MGLVTWTRNRLLLVATVAVWLIAYSAWTADWMAGGMQFVFERALRRIPVSMFGAGCCWVIKLLLDRSPSERLGRRLALACALCIIASLFQSAVNSIVFYVIAPRWGPTGLVETLQNSAMLAWVFFAWAGLYFAIDLNASAQDTRLRLADAQTAAQQARNRALAQQISPHFLFNALNTLSSLIIERQLECAEQVTLSIAAVLRRSLETESREFVPLGEELQAIGRYLEIEQSRFAGRLNFLQKVPADLLDLAVPPMILQPIVENVIKHGVALSTEQVHLSILGRVEAGALKLVVVDDAVPRAGARFPEGHGIGQANVRQRLALLYGNAASLTCEKCYAGGYSATLSMPAEAYVEP